MRIVYNKKDTAKALLLAFNNEDTECLEALYNKKIVFGLWKIWIRNPDKKGENEEDIKFLLQKLPKLMGIGWLNITNFI